MTISVETAPTLLYKYGQDTSSMNNRFLPNSSLGKMKSAALMSSTASVLSENTDTYIDKLRSGSVASASETMMPPGAENSVENAAHMNFLINMERNRNKSSKLVSGSQFRIPTKDNHRCENCEVFNQTNKKMKESIRSLKLQITRLEEKMHILKMSKNNDFSSSNMSKTDNSLNLADYSSNNSNDNRSEYELLKQRCDYYEEELSKVKKILNFERQTNETIKKSFEDTKNTLNLEILDHKQAVTALTNEHNVLKVTNRNNEITIENLNATLLNYKQQLEKSENKLSDCMM